MEEIRKKSSKLEVTERSKNILGARVISKNGSVIGKVLQVRVNRKSMKVEGIVVKTGVLRKIYVGRDYFEKLSPESILLKIDPSVLMKGKKVVTYEGEIIGKVRKIEREKDTNKAKKLVVWSLWRGKFEVPIKFVKYRGDSIILKKKYDVPKKRLWNRKS